MFAIDVVFGCLLLLLAVVFVAAVAVTLKWDSWLNHIFPEYDVCLCCVSVQLMTGARRVIMVLIRECSTHPHASHHPVQLISVLLELWLPLFPKIQSDKLLCSTRHGNYIEMLCNAGNTVNHNEPVFFSSMFMSVFQIVFFFLYFLLLLMLFVCLVYYLTIKYRAMRFQVEVVTTAVEFFCLFFSQFSNQSKWCVLLIGVVCVATLSQHTDGTSNYTSWLMQLTCQMILSWPQWCGVRDFDSSSEEKKNNNKLM